MNKHAAHANTKHGIVSCNGAALVEFAVVLPILLTLAFGLTELGRVLYQQNQLIKEVNIGARYTARYPNAVTSVCGEGDAWDTVETWARNQVAQASDGLSPDSVVIGIVERNLTINGESRKFCVIEVRASMNFDALFGESIVPFLNLSPITLSARTEERYIAF